MNRFAAEIMRRPGDMLSAFVDGISSAVSITLTGDSISIFSSEGNGTPKIAALLLLHYPCTAHAMEQPPW